MELELLNNLGLKVTKTAAARLEDFIKVFVTYNSHTNLMSKNDVDMLFEKHIYDSLAISLFFKKYGYEKFKLLDIGTGGGFPSIPIAVFYEKSDILAIDSVSKKIGFVELAKKELRLEHLTPASKRVEDLYPADKESFDIVTSRAVAQLNVLLEYAIPFLKVGGYFAAYKSLYIDEELENASNALNILGAKVADKIEYDLPNLKDYKRQLVIIKKIAKTPLIYPRKAGTAKKMPL